MGYTLTLRNTRTDEIHVWTGRDIVEVAERFAVHRKRIRDGRTEWTAGADEYILREYARLGPAALIVPLSLRLGRRITRLAIIGRHHRLKQRLKIGTEQRAIELAVRRGMDAKRELE